MAVTLWHRTPVRGHDASACPFGAVHGDYRPTHACPHHVDAAGGRVRPEPLGVDRVRSKKRPPAKRSSAQPPARRAQEAVDPACGGIVSGSW